MGASIPSLLTQNCKASWPVGVCDVGNLCAFVSATIWFFALIPQMHKNYKKKAVDGLSILWATSLFTGAFVHSFYVFQTRTNVYFKIHSVCWPVISFALLLQFWIYSKQNSQMKLSYIGGCILIWGALITFELAVPRPHGADKLEWVAVVLFSIYIVPQLMLNILIRTTAGQSTVSVVVVALTSIFEFLGLCLLHVPTQFKIQSYFSCTMALVNCIQVIWYPSPITSKKKRRKRYGTISTEEDETVRNPFAAIQDDPDDRNRPREAEDADEFEGIEPISDQELRSIAGSQVMYFPGYLRRIKEMNSPQLFLFFLILLSATCLTVGVCIATKTGYVLIGSFVIFVTLFGTSMYRDHREGRLILCDNVYSHVQNKVFGDLYESHV